LTAERQPIGLAATPAQQSRTALLEQAATTKPAAGANSHAKSNNAIKVNARSAPAPTEFKRTTSGTGAKADSTN